MDIYHSIRKGLNQPTRIPHYLKRKLLDYYYNYDAAQMNIYEKDWDLLIVLDGCRVDTLNEVSSEYSFLPDKAPSIISVGGGSAQWLANTFSNEWLTHINQTAYISANPHTRRVLSDEMQGLYAKMGGPENQISNFKKFNAVWETHWDEEFGTVPAEAVADQIIDHCRSDRCTRTIGHFMQPHFPSVRDPIGDGMNISNEANWEDNDVWTLISEGQLSVERAYESYKNNLRYVLDQCETLLTNIDAHDVVITADHGNAFGEWGEYAHGQSYIRSVREVPWIETTATNTGEYTPLMDNHSNEQQTTVEEKLEALGYKV